MGALACTGQSELWTLSSAGGDGAPLAESVAEPSATSAETIPGTTEPAQTPELFELLSTDDLPVPAAVVEGADMQAVPSLVADSHKGLAATHVDRIRQKPTTKSISLARVHAGAFQENHLNMALNATQKLRASKKHFKTLGDGSFLWAGEVPGAAALSTFVVRNGQVTGSIRDENNVLYLVEPVGDGVHALTQMDETRFAPMAQPVQVPGLEGEAGGHAPASAPSTAMSVNPVEIDVLVAYTPAARKARSDMDSLIRLAIEETIQTYQNSGIRIRLNLVDSFEFNYTEHKDWQLMLAEFATNSTVRSRRDASGADAAMLIINDTQTSYCGMAYLLKNVPADNAFEAAYAFGLVHYGCAVGGYVFGHELGHIQGAHHNEHIATNKTFPYGHGYIYSVASRTNNFSTVMSYDWGTGCTHTCPKIPYWSSPNVRYNGIPTGTASTNDNVRVLNETAANVAAFRAKGGGGGGGGGGGTPPPSCTLKSPIASIPQAGGTYVFEADCTHSPSSYAWTVNGEPQAAGQRLSYTFGANTSAASRSFVLSLTATNNTGRSEPVHTTLTQAPPAVSRPVCSFNGSTATVPAAGGTYRITVNCTGTPTSYSWVINGKLHSGSDNPTAYTFPPNTTRSTQTFNIVVTASNSAGTSNQARLTVNQPRK